MLSNLSRYIISSIAAYDKLLLNTHDQRTNAISERRMAIVKRTQLGTQTYTRADVVLQILIQDMQKLIENFSLSYMAASSKDTNTETNQQQLKELTENWRKNNRRGHGFYAKKPDTSIMNNLKYTLVVYSTTINDGLSVPHLPVPNWLNIAIGTLVSIKSIRTSSSLSPKVSTLLINDIINFITKWISSAEYIKRTKKHSAELMHLLNSKFQIPPDIPTDGCGQLNFILHKILLPIIDRYIPAVKEYCCTSCNCTVRTRFSISYIPINMVEVQTQLHHRLNSYFDGCMSDHLCDKCSMTMSRRIKLLECPPVIILRIDYNNVSSTVLRKPPNAIFFQSFLEKTNIGCSSPTIYDVVAFISIMPNTDNKLVLGTKIKQRWRINSMTKLIGNGEKLCKLFANSRLIILERTRTCNSNFIYAIAQCCSFTISNIEHNDFCTCNTLNDAIKIIESEAKLNYLYSMLSSHFTTYYQCQQCRCSPSSLSTTNNGVSIYEQNMEPKFICGSPLTSLDRLDLSCSVCNKKTEDVLLPVHSQIHHQCPPICMYYSQRTILHGVQNLRIELASHDSQSICAYQAISVLLIDEYNGISVVKLDRVSIYCTNPYQTVTTSSVDKINEAFHTAQKTIIFLKKITTPEPSTTLVLQAPVPVRLINKSSGEIVRLNQILNPSNRRLKVGDDGTLKGEGRHHVRVKILCLSDLETCQHQMDIIEETRINNGISTKDNVFHHLKKPTNLAASQTRNHQQTTASKIFVTPKVSDRALTPQWSNHDQSKDVGNLNSTPKQLTTQQRKDDNESFNSSVDQLDDNVLDDDDDIDEETSATGVSDNKRVYDKQNNHTLLIEHNRLRNRFDRLNAKYKALQKENEILKNHTIPIPPPEIQQWFSQTAQRFEKNHYRALTGSLTARAIVPYLFPSKSRTLEDIPDSVRDSILGYVKYCHPNELFVRGKINEAISGPFRTAKFKALHSAAGVPS
ncbi:unnamed protein product [Rotaria magnacalcarata]|uniref:Uncharacterized protein n=1 Tax=Rotaria magnacalcarata TaxID=392030 RepID=A0A8S2M9Q5_9BILA|nr:unnamed protein product [Rotaria magnacalcarata]